MKYILYAIWATIFYFVLVFLHPSWHRFDMRVIIIALISPLLFKQWLPFLKKATFPEISSKASPLLNSFSESISNAMMTSKQCVTCEAKINFKLVLGCETDKMLNSRKTKLFCRSHGLEEWKKELKVFKGALVISEPDINQVSGLFFYKPDDLKTHAYKKEDREVLDRIMKDFVSKKQKDSVLWLPKDVIGICQDSPLFKEEKGFETISIDETIRRVNGTLQKIENKFSKGEFWITEPRGEGGIYIWDGEV